MKRVSLIVAAFNRPEYLKQCLASIAAADLSLVNTILIVDDCSSNPETIRLINEFQLEGVELIKAFSKENRSIKGSLLFGCDLLFNSCDVVTNLDGDAIVSRDAFNRLLELNRNFPSHIATGFNCATKNKDGSVRHKILKQGEGWNKKYSVGGVNMMFSKDVYLQIIRPALQKCIRQGGNWDHQACIISNTGYGREVVVLEPSCVQHIGVETSSMGHMAGGEPPDQADDFIQERSIELIPSKGLGSENSFTGLVTKKLHLPKITLVAADCVNLERLFKAADKCTEHIQFADVKIFTSLTTDEPRCENIIPIEPITSKEAYSWWIMKELAQHVKTSHMLVFQYDGYVLNPSAWKDEWLQWDYIGAPWEFGDPNWPVGNGGFSLRSKKLMDIVASHPDIYPMNEPGVSFQKEEDHVIVRMFGKMLTEKYGIKFAPIEVAEQFAIEAYGVKSPGNQYSGQFGYHGSHVDFSKSQIKP